MSDRPVINVAVRNLLGVKRADLMVSGIALLAGTNRQGKSSILNAVGAAILQAPGMRGLNTKAALAQLVRRGEKAGSVSVGIGNSTVQIRYPDGEVTTSGPPLVTPTPLALGTAPFSAMPPATRTREVAERLGAHPTEADVEAFLAGEEQIQHLRGINDDDGVPLIRVMASRLMEKVLEHGWDAVHQTWRDEGTRARGRWEQIAGERFGLKKAVDWAPRNLRPGEEYTAETERAKLAAAERDLENLVRQSGVSDEQRASLVEIVKDGEQARGRLQSLAAADDDDNRTLRELLAKQNAPDAPLDIDNLIQCPNCRAHIKEVRVTSGPHVGIGTVYECVALPDPDEVETQRREARAVRNEMELVRKRMTARAGDRAGLLSQQREGEKADRRLKQVGEGSVDVGTIAAQRERVEEARSVLNAVIARDQAEDVFSDIQQAVAAVNALAPTGVRAAVLRAKIGAFNEELGDLAKVAGFPAVGLDEEMGVWVMGGDDQQHRIPVQLASASEVWRCDFLFTVAFARREGVPLVLVDALDILAPQDRGGPLKLLVRAGLNAIVAITAKDRGAVPNLDQMKVGTTGWVQDGELSPLGAQAESVNRIGV